MVDRVIRRLIVYALKSNRPWGYKPEVNLIKNQIKIKD